MSVRKHIKRYSDHINEQITPPVPGAQPGAVAQPKVNTYKFIFIDGDSSNVRKYPDGSSTKTYHSYETNEADVKDWIEKNIVSSDKRKLAGSALDVKKQTLLDLIKGEKSQAAPEDIDFVIELKNAASLGKFGKKGPVMTVWFSPKGEMMTDDIETTFIKLAKDE